MGLAVASPVRLEVDKPLEEVGDVEEALHDLGLRAAEPPKRDVHGAWEVREYYYTGYSIIILGR